MKQLSLVLMLAAMVWGQQGAPNEYRFSVDPPAAINNPTATVVGATGIATYYYWVIPNYVGGSVLPSSGVMVRNAPTPLTVANYVRINWPNTGATNYSVIRTTAPNPPSGVCAGCLVSGAVVVGTTVNDNGVALGASALTSFARRQEGYIRLINPLGQSRLVSSPSLYPNGTFSNMPAATATGVSGTFYILTDAIAADDCTVGGGALSALCWSNGTTWVALGGGNSAFSSFTGTVVGNTFTLANLDPVNIRTGNTINTYGLAVTKTIVPSAGTCTVYVYEQAGTLKGAIDTAGVGCDGVFTNISKINAAGFPTDGSIYVPLFTFGVNAGAAVVGSEVDLQSYLYTAKRVIGGTGITVTPGAEGDIIDAEPATPSCELVKSTVTAFSTNNTVEQIAATVTLPALPTGSTVIVSARWTHSGGATTAASIKYELNGTNLWFFGTNNIAAGETSRSHTLTLRVTGVNAVLTETRIYNNGGTYQTASDSGTVPVVNAGAANTLVFKAYMAGVTAETVDLPHYMVSVCSAM